MIVWLWVGFIALVVLALAFDLFVAHRKPHAISIPEALWWTAFWIALSLAFNVLVYFMYEYHWFGIGLHLKEDTGGAKAALDFFTGYVIEKSLSLDNIFVIAMIFAYFHVDRRYEHRVLFWGIVGAMVLRGVMIGAGTALIHRFEWIIYVFGALLIVTAAKMMVAGEGHVEPDRNPLVRLARWVYPVSPTFDGQKFFTRVNGRRAITPLFVCLLVVESTDVLFAIDSIPAIFAITLDPFLVFTSNIFAILGLRSLYFALSGMMHKFRYMKASLVFLLAFVGTKMLLHEVYKIPTAASLGVIAGILAVGVAASLLAAPRAPAPPAPGTGSAHPEHEP